MSSLSCRLLVVALMIIINLIIIIIIIIMSLIKPKFAQAANAQCHVSLSNRNASSLFLKVLRDMSVDRRSCGRLFQTTGPLTEKLRSP